MAETAMSSPQAPTAVPILPSWHCNHRSQEGREGPAPHAHMPRHLRCGYRSKVCASLRAVKRNRSLHRFCEQHRQQANTNQKKWARRRLHSADSQQREQRAPYERSPARSFRALLASALSDATSMSAAGSKETRDESFYGERVYSEPLRSTAALHGAMDDGDLLWEVLGLSALGDEMEFTF